MEPALARKVLLVQVVKALIQQVVSENKEQDAWHLIGRMGVVSESVIANVLSNEHV